MAEALMLDSEPSPTPCAAPTLMEEAIMLDSEPSPTPCAAPTGLSPKKPADASLCVAKNVPSYCCKEKCGQDKVLCSNSKFITTTKLL
jgi:hypothetical protein